MTIKKYCRFICLLVITGFYCSAVAESEPALLAEQVTLAAQSGRPALVLSATESIDEEIAYRIQTLSVLHRLAGKSAQGFKAGLTSTAGQRKFGVTQAVAGVLVSGGRAFDGSVLTIDSADFNHIMMEAELGFEFKVRVTKPIDTIESLKSKVSKVMPIVEFPDLSFDQPNKLKGVDIIANNVIAKQFVYGEGVSPHKLDLNRLQVTVRKEGELLLIGRGSDAMGNQWEALLWLVNRTIKNGWQIEPNQRLITGALGKMLPAKKGSYQFEYGVLGNINIRVR